MVDAEAHGFKAAQICRFARCQTELNCIQEIIAALGRQHPPFIKKFKQRVERIKSISISLTGAKVDFDMSQAAPWQELGAELAATLEELGGEWLIPVDELPIFVLALLKQQDGLNRTHQFLDWFRSLRQQHHQTIHWILAGSIGLDTVTSRLNLGDTINVSSTLFFS